MSNESAATAQAAQPTIPPHLQIGKAKREIVYQETAESRFICALFVGDVIKLEEKQDNPAAALGGHLFRDSRCLPGKMLTRCAITPMYEGHLSTHAAFVYKDDRKYYKKTFIQKNVWNPATNQFEDVAVGRDSTSRNLLYWPIHPAQEVGRLMQRSGIANGVVAIQFLADENDVIAAQMFMFPQWGEFVKGETSVIPTNIRKLKAYIAERKAEALRLGNAKFASVADAYLAACDRYAQWGKRYVDHQTAVIKGGEKHAESPARYDEIAERVLIDLELTREDRLVQNVASQQTNMEEMVKQQAEANKNTARMLDMMAEDRRSMFEIMARGEGRRVETPDLTRMEDTDAKPALPDEEVEVPERNKVRHPLPDGYVEELNKWEQQAEANTARMLDETGKTEVVAAAPPQAESAAGSHVDNDAGMEDLEKTEEQ